MLILKSDTREIGGRKFTATQFPAMRAFGLLARLLKSIGPALGALAQLDPGTQLDLAGGALADAFSKLDPREATALVPEILAGTTVLVTDERGLREIPLIKPENIDLVFSGRMGDLFQALGFALQVNYRDFWPGGQGAPADAASPSAS